MTVPALWHHLANEPIALLPFGQSLVVESPRRAGARWRAAAMSGVARINRDAPMVRWYENLVGSLWSQGEVARSPHIFELPAYADPDDPCTAEAAMRHVMWVPLADAGGPVKAGWLLARGTPWTEAHSTLAQRLAAAYAHGQSAIAGRAKPPGMWHRHQRKLLLAMVAAALALVLVQVPLTILAPVEVVAQQPFVVASAVPGVVERLLVTPGAQVKEGTPLVQLVDTLLRSDFDVASQKFQVARAKVLRLQQASVEDSSAKRELAVAQSEQNVAEVERDFAEAMLEKSVIRSTQPGVALYGDPRDWMGRPVAVGEAILRVADPTQVEYQIKVPVADAVNLEGDAKVKIFLDAAPLEPLQAHVVRAAYKAETDAAGVASFTVGAERRRAEHPAALLPAKETGHAIAQRFFRLRKHGEIVAGVVAHEGRQER